MRVLSIAEVTKVTGLSRRTVYTEVAKGNFPRQIQISTRRVGWMEQNVFDWLKERGAS